MDIDAVAFDIDGTLYPNSRMYLNSILFSLPRLRFLYYFRQVRMRIRSVRPVVNFRETQAQILSDLMNVPRGRAMRRIEHAIYGRWQRTFRHIRPYPFLSDLLLRLKSHGYAVGVLSDFPVGDKLAHLNLPHVWDCVISSEETGYLKPNPEPFIHLASCLGTVPERVLYVGNSYEYDVIGAFNVGMKTAHLAREPAGGSLADIIFDDYRTLENLLLDVVRS
jgi:putative hydrolase of the HAD superfamily